MKKVISLITICTMLSIGVPMSMAAGKDDRNKDARAGAAGVAAGTAAATAAGVGLGTAAMAALAAAAVGFVAISVADNDSAHGHTGAK